MTFLEDGPSFAGHASPWEVPLLLPQSAITSRTFSGECFQLALPHNRLGDVAQPGSR